MPVMVGGVTDGTTPEAHNQPTNQNNNMHISVNTLIAVAAAIDFAIFVMLVVLISR